MRRFWLAPMVVLALVAAACSDNEDTGSLVAGTETPASAQQPETPGSITASPAEEVAETPEPTSTETPSGLSVLQQEISDAMFEVVMGDDERPDAITGDDVRCLSDGTAGMLSDSQIVEQGITAERITREFEVSDGDFIANLNDVIEAEVPVLVDLLVRCFDWRSIFVEEMMADEGVQSEMPPEFIGCMVEAYSTADDEVIAELLTLTLVSDDDFSSSGPIPADSLGLEAVALTRDCLDLRGWIYSSYVNEAGMPDETARCVADSLPEEFLDSLLLMDGFVPQSDSEPGGEDATLSGEPVLDFFGMMFEAMRNCVDVREMMYGQLVAEQGISESSARCFVDGLSEGFFDEIFELIGAGMSGGGGFGQQDQLAPEVFGQFIEVAGQCMTPEELDMAPEGLELAQLLMMGMFAAQS